MNQHIENCTKSNVVSTIRILKCSAEYLSAFGSLVTNDRDYGENSKICVSITFAGLLDDPSVLIEGVLFRARYLGSTQLVCEGQPTKSTRMCQAEEAVSRIKVRFIILNFLYTYYHSSRKYLLFLFIFISLEFIRLNRNFTISAVFSDNCN